MKSKKIIFVIMIICFLFTLIGCYDYKEIEQTIIVLGIGIDKDINTGEYEVSAEILNTDELSAQPSLNTQVISYKGKTIYEAMNNLINISSQEIYFTNAQILVIGEELGKEGLYQVVDSLINNNDIRLSIDLLVAKGMSGKDLLLKKSKIAPILSNELKQNLNEVSKNLSLVIKMPLYKGLDTLIDKSQILTIPVVSVEEELGKNSSEEEGNIFLFESSAVFKDDKLVGYLEKEESLYYSILTNNVNSGIITNKNEDFQGSLKINESSLSLTLEDSDLRAEVFISGQIMDYYSKEGIFDLNNEEDSDKVKSIMATYIEDQLREFIKESNEKYGFDIFSFPSVLDSEGSSKYEDLDFSQIKVNVDVTLNLEHEKYSYDIKGGENGE